MYYRILSSFESHTELRGQQVQWCGEEGKSRVVSFPRHAQSRACSRKTRAALEDAATHGT